MALNAESFVDEVPETYEEIYTRNDKDDWKQAVQEEIKSLDENDTWDIVDLPPGKRAISSKWVFRIKRDTNGDIERYKARLVVKGCAQKQGFDYEETYAPVARLSTLRTLLSVINQEDLHTRQLDVKNAFLHGELHEEIYMKIPSGFENKVDKVCKLKKALYSLKQAPRAWNETFDKFARELGFVNSTADRCLYIAHKGKSKIFLLLYVDDIILAGTDESQVISIKIALEKKFRMKDLGNLNSFLGIKITRPKNGTLVLNQRNYFEKLLTRFEMEQCNPVATPMETNFELQEEDTELEEKTAEPRPYRELIGCLMYATTTTRPDLCATVNLLSRHQSHFTEKLWKGLKRVLRYIKGTLDLCLIFRKNKAPVMSCYADANFGSEADRKSTSGYLIHVYGNPVLWATRRQNCVALSSTEAEYVALAHAATELLWVEMLTRDLGIEHHGPLIIYEDNQACIRLLHRWEHRRLKHIDVKYNFIRDLAEKKKIRVEYINTKEQLADVLTKALPRDQHVTLCQKLGMVTEEK